MITKRFAEDKSRSTLVRVLFCIVILAVGIAGFVALKGMKKAPAQAVQKERPIKVKALRVVKENVAVTIYGNGELRSVRTLDVVAEVSGKIVSVHRKLAVGQRINKGELLFEIEDSDYRADYEMNIARLAFLKREKELNDKEFTRLQTLLKKDRVGTEVGVEAAEKAANSSADRLAQVEQALVRAKNNLARCRQYAPYDCRVISKNIELSQYVTPGKMLFSLSDDSLLELNVAVDSRDAMNWLEFEGQGIDSGAGGWFAPPKRVPVALRWTEAPNRPVEAVLDRVGSFNPKTRSVELIIELDGLKASQLREGFPLVAGMFCTVEIPGRIMENVVSLPRWAVSFDGNVYVVKENRLVTTPVELLRVEGEVAYVSKGLEVGDMVITTRLANPLEQSLIEVIDISKGDK